MNGVDAVVVATGNDWRAVGAGAHAFAARSGRYAPLCTWWLEDDGPSCRAPGDPLAWAPWAGRCARTARTAGAGAVRGGSAAELSMVAAAAGMAPTWPRCARCPPRASSAATWRCNGAPARPRRAEALGAAPSSRRRAPALPACGRRPLPSRPPVGSPARTARHPFRARAPSPTCFAPSSPSFRLRAPARRRRGGLDANEARAAALRRGARRAGAGDGARRSSRYPDACALELRRAMRRGGADVDEGCRRRLGRDHRLAAHRARPPAPGPAGGQRLTPSPTFVMYRMSARARGLRWSRCRWTPGGGAGPRPRASAARGADAVPTSSSWPRRTTPPATWSPPIACRRWSRWRPTRWCHRRGVHRLRHRATSWGSCGGSRTSPCCARSRRSACPRCASAG